MSVKYKLVVSYIHVGLNKQNESQCDNCMIMP